METNEIERMDSVLELSNVEHVNQLWKVWSKQMADKAEVSGEIDIRITLDENGTEVLLEKSPMWHVKNQTMTTKQQDYQYYIQKRRKIVDEKNYIENLLKTEIYELGVVSELQKYIEERLKCDKEKMQSVLERIYLENFFGVSVSVFVNLLLVISQIDYLLIEPAGPIMALAATRHENCEVREFGLRCYENWEDVACLQVLKRCYFEEPWLQNYLNMLIEDMEEVN